MSSIYDTRILDILPSNLKQNPDIVAAAQAIDSSFFDVTKDIEKLSILSNIDHLPEDVIDHLLWQFHITYEEGAGLAETLQEKRNLVKNAIGIHRIKGTKAALERVLELLNMRGVIDEWFEYGGEPYFFRIRILEVENRDISAERLALLDKLIDAYKNTRSWLETINIYLTTRGKMYLASSTISGEEITVYPWQQTEIVTRGSIFLGAATRSAETVSTYPNFL